MTGAVRRGTETCSFVGLRAWRCGGCAQEHRLASVRWLADTVHSERSRRGWRSRRGRLTAVLPTWRSVARSAAVLSALRGPHAERRSSRSARRRRVPETVPVSTLELQHGRPAANRKH